MPVPQRGNRAFQGAVKGRSIRRIANVSHEANMSKAIHHAPLAITSDGTVLLSAAAFDVPKDLDHLVNLARQERGAVFVGLALAPRETEQHRLHLDDATLQAAFFAAGARQLNRRRSR